MARPSKLTPEVADRILRALRAGNHVEAAARSAGIGPSTFYRWLERAERESEGPFREFAEEVRRAEAEASVLNLNSRASHHERRFRRVVPA